MLSLVRALLFIYDIEDLRQAMDEKQWRLLSTFQFLFSVGGLFFHFFCFNSQEYGHRAFGILFINMIFGSIIVQIFEYD